MIHLPPGYNLTPLHRFCPTCGEDLTQQMPEASHDQPASEQVEGQADGAGAARIAGDLQPADEAALQRMIAPLTQAEKERAKRNEQRWRRGQQGQGTTARQQKHSEAGDHQGLIPMIKRQLTQWVIHLRQFISGR